VPIIVPSVAFASAIFENWAHRFDNQLYRK